MYKHGLIASIAIDDLVLSESNAKNFDHSGSTGPTLESEVRIPYDTEYNIKLTNTNTLRKILIHSIQIDGKNVCSDLVVNEQQYINLEGKMNTQTGETNAFKFIKITDRIRKHLDINPDDQNYGRVIIDFSVEEKKSSKIRKLEKEINDLKKKENDIYSPFSPPYKPWPNPWEKPYTPIPMWIGDGSGTGDPAPGFMNCNVSNYVAEIPNHSSSMQHTPEERGMTTKGSEKTQKFITVSDFETDESARLVFVLVPAVKSIGSRSKIVCDTCGTKNNPKNKYCTHCGTYIADQFDY